MLLSTDFIKEYGVRIDIYTEKYIFRLVFGIKVKRQIVLKPKRAVIRKVTVLYTLIILPYIKNLIRTNIKILLKLLRKTLKAELTAYYFIA